MNDLQPVSSFRTERTARVAHLGPTGAEGALWICLHGYRQLAPWFLRRFGVLDDGSRRIVAPEALNRFYVGDPDGRHGPDARVGATWMTREDRAAEMADYTAYLERVLEVESEGAPPRPTVVLGFSQGAHTAARWMHRSGHDVHAVVLWGEGLPHDSTEDELTRAQRRWILVRGDADPSRSAAREAEDARRLDAASARWEVRTHAGGHRIETDALEELARYLGG